MAHSIVLHNLGSIIFSWIFLCSEDIKKSLRWHKNAKAKFKISKFLEPKININMIFLEVT
jgi:hypothetical protein